MGGQQLKSLFGQMTATAPPLNAQITQLSKLTHQAADLLLGKRTVYLSSGREQTVPPGGAALAHGLIN